MNNNWVTINTTITVTEKNKERIRCIIKELEALGAIPEIDGNFILNVSESI